MARLVLALLFAILLLAGLAVIALGLRAVRRAAEGGKGIDMAENGMLPRLAYFLLLALILYVALWGGG